MGHCQEWGCPTPAPGSEWEVGPAQDRSLPSPPGLSNPMVMSLQLQGKGWKGGTGVEEVGVLKGLAKGLDQCFHCQRLLSHFPESSRAWIPEL